MKRRTVILMAIALCVALMPTTPKVAKPPLPRFRERTEKPVRIVSQPPNSGVRTGGFFGALTVTAQQVALQNPVQLAVEGSPAFAYMRRRGVGGMYTHGTAPLLGVLPNTPYVTNTALGAHELAHALWYETPNAPSVLPLESRYRADPTFRRSVGILPTGANIADEVFARMMAGLATSPGAIAGRNPAGGFREVFTPFVNRAYLWPYRPGPRVTGGVLSGPDW